MKRPSVGDYILCYQKFKPEGLTDTPFVAKIVADLGLRWGLEDPLFGDLLKAHKGACSSKPVKKES